MQDATKKFLIFTVAVLAAVAVRFVAEEWFYFPETVARALGFFVMGVIIKPLVAPDLPMARWMVMPLTGMAIVLVILTAPRWYESWTAPDYTLPAFMPTEEDFIGQVVYYAKGSMGNGSPRDCGTYRPGDDATPGKQCAEEALAADEAFYLFDYPQGTDSFIGLAIAYPGFNEPHRFTYSRGRLPLGGTRSHLEENWCPEPRFLAGTRMNLQCGPWPTPSEFHTEIGVGKDCGRHVFFGTVASNEKRLDCAIAAIKAGEAFHYRFSTDFGDDMGLIDGALSWDPVTTAAPTLSYYFNPGPDDDPDPTLVQRTCESPRLRLVRPTSERWRQAQRRTSVEVDCGDDLTEPR